MKRSVIVAVVVILAIVTAGIGTALWFTRAPYVEETLEDYGRAGASEKSAEAGDKKAVKKSDKSSDEEETSAKTEATTEVPTTTDSSFEIKLHFVGDLLCATDARTNYENCFEDVAKRVKPSYFLKKVSKYFLNDDYTIGDAENVYSNKNLAISEKGQTANPGIEAYWFKTKKKNARILKAGGINYVSIENNHIMDYGAEGREDTRKAIAKAGVVWGDESQIRYYEKQGFSIAVIAVSMYSDAVLPNIKKYIKKASKRSDYQIVYFHGGTEAIHEPEQWKVNACRKMVDYGADLVIGDHPHVLQPLEKYKGTTIIYSMGNFVFGGNRHPENRTIIYRHTLKVGADGKLQKQKGKIIPCYVYTGATNNWQPAVIKDKATKKRVKNFMKGKTKSPL